MSNREIKAEIVYNILIFLICSVVTIYNSSFIVGLAFGLLVYFPVTFVVISIRELFQKYTRRPQNIFLLFITSISIVVTISFEMVSSQMQSLMTAAEEGWTIYPPLTSAPSADPSNDFTLLTFIAFTLLLLQLTVVFITCRQIFKKTE